MPRKDGGPAFPARIAGETLASGGASLRDLFAGMALQGILAGWPADGAPPKPKLVAVEAFEFADAMLAEREKSDG